MEKNTFKLILDLIMSALLILMFKKNVLTLAFHEIGGIIVCLLFIFHFIINFNWVKAITKKIFAQNTPFKMRLSYIIDILLLIDTIAILFTGIGINKNFSPKIAFLPKSATPFHFFTGGLFVILICIHIGLHWNWIKNMFYKKSKKPFAKPAVITLSVFLGILMVFGAINLSKSSLSRWLTMIFAAPRIENHSLMEKHDLQNNVLIEENNESSQTGKQQNKQQKNAGRKMQNGQAKGSGQGQEQGMRRNSGMGKNKPKITFKSVTIYLFKWITIFVLLSALTAIIEKLLTKLKKKRQPKPALSESAQQISSE